MNRSPRSWARRRSCVPSARTTVSHARSGRPVSAQGRNEHAKQYHSSLRRVRRRRRVAERLARVRR